MKINKQDLERLYNDDKLTLREIGEQYGVTRERVRQVMECFNLPRNTKRGNDGHHVPHYKTPDDYFQSVEENKWMKNNISVLSRFFPKQTCQVCGRVKNLHFHHLKYPAKNRKDIEILCASCHQSKHHKNMLPEVRKQMVSEYKKTHGLYGNGVELSKKYGISKGRFYQIKRALIHTAAVRASAATHPAVLPTSAYTIRAGIVTGTRKKRRLARPRY